jgi:hypothetical protein
MISQAGGTPTASSVSTLKNALASNPGALAKILSGGSVANIVGGLLGAAGTAYGASQAAGINAAASQNAANTLSSAYTGAANILAPAATTAAGQKVAGLNDALATSKSTLAGQVAAQQPYYNAGTTALNTLSAGLQSGGQFNRAFSQSDMGSVMPAETFAEKQALAAMQNQMAMGGQGLSSNAISGAGLLAGNIASSYEQQAFNQWLAQNNLTLGALQNAVATGQTSANAIQNAMQQAGLSQESIQTAIGSANAAGTLGSAQATAAGGVNSAQAQANGIMGVGNANATGTATVTNSLASGVGNALNNYGTMNTLASLLNPTSTTTSTPPATSATPSPGATTPVTTDMTYGLGAGTN